MSATSVLAKPESDSQTIPSIIVKKHLQTLIIIRNETETVIEIANTLYIIVTFNVA